MPRLAVSSSRSERSRGCLTWVDFTTRSFESNLWKAQVRVSELTLSNFHLFRRTIPVALRWQIVGIQPIPLEINRRRNAALLQRQRQVTRRNGCSGAPPDAN